MSDFNVPRFRPKKKHYEISEIDRMQGGWDTWQPITIESGHDLTTDKSIAMAKIDIEKANPEVIAFAWVCTSWTFMQNVNRKDPGHAERLAQQRSLLLKTLSPSGTYERRHCANGELFLARTQWDRSLVNNLLCSSMTIKKKFHNR